MSSRVDDVVGAYLADLRRTSESLPAGLRSELVSSVEEHIEQARAAGQLNSPSDAQRVTTQLGDPAHLVAEMAATEQESSLPRPHEGTGWVLGWLTLGSLVPVAGWLYGVSLLWRSTAWGTREKVAGTLLFPFGVLGAIASAVALGFASVQTCSTSSFSSGSAETVIDRGCTSVGGLSPWLAWALLGLVLLATVAGPVLLARTRRR